MELNSCNQMLHGNFTLQFFSALDSLLYLVTDVTGNEKSFRPSAWQFIAEHFLHVFILGRPTGAASKNNAYILFYN